MPNLKQMFSDPKYKFETSLFYECGTTPEGHSWQPGDSYSFKGSHSKCPAYLYDYKDPTLIMLCECPEHKDVQELLAWVTAGDKAAESR